MFYFVLVDEYFAPVKIGIQYTTKNYNLILDMIYFGVVRVCVIIFGTLLHTQELFSK